MLTNFWPEFCNLFMKSYILKTLRPEWVGWKTLMIVPSRYQRIWCNWVCRIYCDHVHGQSKQSAIWRLGRRVWSVWCSRNGSRSKTTRIENLLFKKWKKWPLGVVRTGTKTDPNFANQVPVRIESETRFSISPKAEINTHFSWRTVYWCRVKWFRF